MRILGPKPKNGFRISQEGRSVPYQSVGEFIKAADAVGEVRNVENANLDLDVGCLTELMAERKLVATKWRELLVNMK